METIENISKKSTLKSILLGIFGAGILAAGYFVFDQVQENQKLQDQLNEQELYAATNDKAFAAIENNLAEVVSREGYISSIPGESGSASTEARIVKEIAVIDKLMKQNNAMIKDLSAKLGERDIRLVNFKKWIAALEQRLNEYRTRGNIMVAESQSLKMDLMEANKQGVELQQEVADLQQGLNARDEEIDAKTQMICWQSDELEQKNSKIRTAYYVVGTYKELFASNVAEKKGGLIGVGSTKTLKKDFDRNAFHQIDIYNYRNIPVFGGNISILTNHNTDSYELTKDEEGNVQWIKITDPDKFWEISKYLVVATKDPLYVEKMLPVSIERIEQ